MSQVRLSAIPTQSPQLSSESEFRANDYYCSSLLGFLAGIMVIPVFFHLGLKYVIVFALLPVFFALLLPLGLWIANALSNRFFTIRQFSKFVAVGTLNTAIDFGTINILSMASGITSGLIVGGINIPGLSFAIVNSYLWNKLWVFSAKGGATSGGKSKNDFSDLPLFFAVTIVGLFINSGIVVALTTFVGPIGTIPGEVWLNISKVAATGISLIWTFSGFKFLVFRAPNIGG